MTPNFFEIGACAVFAAFGAVSLVASFAVSFLWPLARRRVARLGPRARARWLLALRMLPTALALAASMSVALPSFLEFESPDTTEMPGGILEAFAVVGFVIGAAGVVRLCRVLARTRRVVRTWSRSARPAAVAGVAIPALRVSSPLPLIALAGWRRPVLFLSDAVIDGCAPRLLGAISAHEIGHRRALDNLKRLALAACCDPLARSAAGREITAAWEAAAEEAADDAAVALGAGPADLAEALLVVQRLAPSDAWPAVPAAAFYQGGCLEGRVRRLLAEGPAPVEAVPGRARRLLTALAFLACWALAAEALHRPARRLLEHAVVAQPGQLRGLVVVPHRT